MPIHKTFSVLSRGALPRPEKTIVIAGGGVAGLRTAEALRHQGFAGPLIGFGAEALPPYDRTQLSTVAMRDAEWSPQPLPSTAHGFWWFLDMAAVSLDVDGRRIGLDDGRHVDFDALVIATGRRAAILPAAPEAMRLRTLTDAHRLRSVLLARTGHLTIAGAGIVGAEVAGAARTLGWQVTIVDAVQDPLADTLGAEPASWVWDQHRDHGVDLRFGTAVTAVRHHQVELADGATLDADAVVTTVGTVPNTDWLANSGLDIADGVRTDDSRRARTAAGDAAAAVVAVGGVTGNRWSPVGDARRAAATLLGQPPPDDTPSTFSMEVYTHELRVTGQSDGTVAVEFGDR